MAVNGDLIGPLAILVSEPGQVRKEAATVYDVCAGMWLVRLPPNLASTFQKTFVNSQDNSSLTSVST